MVAVVELPWYQKPEFAVILAVVSLPISVVASLYAQEIRRSFRWPRKRMVRSLLTFSEAELLWVEHLHDSAYNLLLWFGWCIYDMAKWVLLIMLLGLVTTITISLVAGHIVWTAWLFMIGPAIGTVIGRGTRQYGRIVSLYNYDNTIARLKVTIEQCRIELEKPL
jgi:hypothetical protein